MIDGGQLYSGLRVRIALDRFAPARARGIVRTVRRCRGTVIVHVDTGGQIEEYPALWVFPEER